MTAAHERRADYYLQPRYPVDEPPTYRARCGCGWTGPERYRGITDHDWSDHMTEMSAAEARTVARFENAQPAPESWGHPHHWIGTHDHGPVCSVCGIAKPEGGGEGLREVLAEAIFDHHPMSRWGAKNLADAVLTLPELAALRAKAAAADRVLDLVDRADAYGYDLEPDDVRAAVFGRPPC